MLELVRQAVTRVIVTESSINLELATHGLIAAFERAVPRHGSAPTLEPLPLVKTAPVFLTQAYTPARRGSELRLVLPPSQAGVSRPNLSLLKAIVRAQEWRRRIVAGEIHSKEQIARETRLNPRYVGRILRLAVLAPRIVQAIVDREPVAEFPLAHFHSRIPLSWEQQQAGLMRL